MTRMMVRDLVTFPGLQTTPPSTDVVSSTRAGTGPSRDAIITTVIVVVGVCVFIAMTIAVILYLTLRKRGKKVQRSDKERLIMKEGKGVQNKLADLEDVEVNPFGRELSSPTPEE